MNFGTLEKIHYSRALRIIHARSQRKRRRDFIRFEVWASQFKPLLMQTPRILTSSLGSSFFSIRCISMFLYRSSFLLGEMMISSVLSELTLSPFDVNQLRTFSRSVFSLSWMLLGNLLPTWMVCVVGVQRNFTVTYCFGQIIHINREQQGPQNRALWDPLCELSTGWCLI